MLDDSGLWFLTGLEHIADFGGYDHILFVSLLVVAYPFQEWKKLLFMVTAFTAGHSISLAASITGFISSPRLLTELLIAASILLTALYHLLNPKQPSGKRAMLVYGSICFFGLIHGLGFSYLLRSMLGGEHKVAWPLFCFNLGLEAGQLFIVALVILFSLLLTFALKIPFKPYKQVVTCIIALVAVKLCVERSLELFQS